MQGRMVGSSRTPLGPRYVAPPGAAVPSRDVISFGTSVGRDHGSRPALVRSLMAMSLLAAGLGALVARGGDLSTVGIGTAVASSSAETPLAMPKPRIQLVASAILPPSPTVLTSSSAFAPIHDLDTEIGSNAVDRVSYDYLLNESAIGDPNDILEFGPMKIRRHLVQKIVRAAQAVQTDAVLLMAVADKESSFKTEVQAQTSSATGLYQFIERTWLGVMRDFGAKHGVAGDAALVVNGENGKPTVTDPAERTRILEMRRDPYLSALMAGEMLKRDASRIALKIGRDLTLGEVYLAHFLGVDDAEDFLAKVADKPKAAAAQMLPGPARANRSIFFAAQRGRKKAASLSVAEVHGKFESMMSTRGARYRDVRSVAGILAYADATVE